MTIRLPSDIRRDLERLSQKEHIPISDLVRKSLRRFIAVYQFNRVRAKMVPYAEALGIFTDEDVFRQIK